jgi:hypothetical protein
MAIGIRNKPPLKMNSKTETSFVKAALVVSAVGIA